MPAAPRVSVIVPVHRGGEFLPATLGSILRQTYRDFEIVVAGDGAADSVEKAALSTGDPRVRWEGFSKAPGFGYSNRARAIAQARGSLIAYCAPDDLWAPDHLERLVSALDRDGLDMVFSRPILVWGRGVPRPHFLPFDLARGGLAPARWLLCCLSPSQTLHTRDAHARAGGWRDGLPSHGDVDLWLRCRKFGAKVAFLPKATVVRFPAYAFKGESEKKLVALHSRYAGDLASGRLVLANLRWSAGRRVLGWTGDLWVAGRLRGWKWTRAMLRRPRAVQRPVDPNPPEPRAEAGSRSTR